MPSREAQKSWALGPGEPQEVWQIQVQGLHQGHGNPNYQYKVGDERIECSSAKKDLEAPVDGKLGMS